MIRRAAKVDANQPEIVAALRKAGASVTPLHAVGSGFPDLAVGYRGTNHLLEVKDGAKPPSARKLTDDEAAWHATWRGSAAVVKDIPEALATVGIKTT